MFLMLYVWQKLRVVFLIHTLKVISLLLFKGK